MALVITPLTEGQIGAVREFNARLRALEAYREFQIPERPSPNGSGGQKSIREEYFVAMDGSAVRGGYILRHQMFSFCGETRTVAHYRQPVSEGVVNRAYAGLGAQMLITALRMQPLLYALGMGGTEQPLPRMLQAMGWSIRAVPFFFKVNHPCIFLRKIQALRSARWRRLVLDAAAATGAGWLGVRAFETLHRRSVPEARAELVASFGSWADELWRHCAPHYALSAVRDSELLNFLYPEPDARFLRLRVTQNGATRGWAVMLDTQMHGHKQFGDLRVGSIVDCLAQPEDAPCVVSKASELLIERGVDLIVSNQLHESWGAAFRRCGYFEAPSNFAFAMSKKLRAMLEPFDRCAGAIHCNRGDGDGPIHL